MAQAYIGFDFLLGLAQPNLGSAHIMVQTLRIPRSIMQPAQAASADDSIMAKSRRLPFSSDQSLLLHIAQVSALAYAALILPRSTELSGVLLTIHQEGGFHSLIRWSKTAFSSDADSSMVMRTPKRKHLPVGAKLSWAAKKLLRKAGPREKS
ncbi:hypothetical protein J4E91_002263 [Alternaria rosae]|nr:hypothetical protein J4E91_002263 [Alternaria rosae]